MSTTCQTYDNLNQAKANNSFGIDNVHNVVTALAFPVNNITCLQTVGFNEFCNCLPRFVFGWYQYPLITIVAYGVLYMEVSYVASSFFSGHAFGVSRW